MANGESQTEPAGSGDGAATDTTSTDTVQLDKVQTSKSKKKSIPEGVFEDSGMVKFLKGIHPKYQGWNSARLRSELIKNDDLLNEFSDRIINDSVEMNEGLGSTYEEQPEVYEEHRQRIKDRIESSLTQDVLKGKTTKQNIVDRTLDIRKTDISGFKSSTTEFEHQGVVEKEARKNGLDPNFVMSVIEQESGFKQDSESNKGAIGYMQLMPDTAKELGVDPHDPEENIKGGVEYLAKQINNHDNIQTALAAYNAGPGAVEEADGVPNFEETKGYIENIVGNYQQRSGQGLDYRAPVSDYQKIAEENPEKYRDLGIVDADGNFKYGGEGEAKTFKSKLINDDDLHRELMGDRFNQFREELADSHNTGAVDEQDIDDTAKAWAVYDQFGSEGLTKYLNVDEHYQEGVPLDEQPSAVQEGVEYLRHTEQGGFRPGDYVETFFGQEGSPVGRFEVTPVTQSKELQEDVQKDLNNWTRTFINADNSDQGLSNILEMSRKNQEGADFDSVFDTEAAQYIPFSQSEGLRNIEEAYKKDGLGSAAFQTGAEALSAVSQAFGGAFGVYSTFNQPDTKGHMNENGELVQPDSDEIPSLVNRMLFGEGDLSERVDIEQDFEEAQEDPTTPYKQATNKQIAHDLANGLDTNWSRAAKIDILREAQSEEGSFQVSDLARTVMANHDEYSEKDGNAVYKIDYENASPRTRTAIDVLRHDEQMSKSFYRAKDGQLIFEPNYLNRVAKNNIPKYATSLDWEKKVVHDEKGEPIGYREVQGEQGVWQSLGNTLTSFGYQTAKFLDDHAVKPTIEKGLMGLMDEAANTFENDAIREYKDRVENAYQESWRENLDTSITQRMQVQGAGDLLPTATAWATPFAAYLYTAGKIGNAGLKQPANFLKQAKKVRHKSSMEAASMFLKPTKSNKLKLASQKLAKSAKHSERWNEYGRFALGAVPLEASGGDQWSIFGQGLADMTSRALLDEDADLEKKYATSERATQIGMDVLGTEAIALLADNLLLGLPKFIGGGVKALQGKKSTGRTFIDNQRGFEKVESPEFASESVRFFHNMFNGLQDQAIGEIPESMAHRLKGRAFVENPGNVQSLSDAVVRFTEEADEIFADSKSTIRNTIKRYDKQFGGEIRLNERQIEERTKEVHDQFMDKTAENMKGFLEKTSDDATLPFKISNLLAEQAPRFKGQVPYVDENGPRHLMTRAEANELASESYRYTVKPAEGGDYARVFEISDGLWTTDLANRIKYKYTETNPDDIIRRQAEAQGLGAKVNFGPNDEEIEQLDRIASNVNNVYGQEVEVDGIRGHITDFDKNGFVIKDAEGQVHKGVKIETLDDLIQENLGVSQYSGQIDDVVEGGEARLTGQQVADVNQGKMKPENVDYFGLTSDARNLLRNLDQEQTQPAFLSDNLKRIARENGVEIGEDATPRSVVNKLREKGFSSKTSKQLDDLLRADELMDTFNTHANSTRKVSGTGDEMQSKTGLMQPLMDQLNTFAGYANRSASTARKFAKLLGVDNTDGLNNMVKNVKEMTRWNPAKVGDDGINANRGFLYNTNGTDEHFINVSKVTPEDTPRVWDMDENGRLTYSSKWRRTEPNQTLSKDGELRLYTSEDIDGTTWYRPAEEGEEGVFINVQNPTKNQDVTKKEVYAEGIDAVEKKVDGLRHYQLVNEGQQTVNPTMLKERRAKIYNSDSTIKKPTKEQTEAIKDEGQKEIANKLRQAGLGRSLAYGMAGSFVDNVIDTTAGEDDGYKVGLFSVLGALAGSRRIRTKTSNFIDSFTSKPVKNIFDNEASATYQVDKQVQNKKERETYGFFVNENNQTTIDMANSAIQDLKGLGDKAVATWDNFRNSRFARSSFMWLNRLNNPAANRLTTALERINETVNEIASIPRRNFAAQIESLEASGAIREGTYDNIADAYDIFRNDRGPQIVKDIFPDRDMTDARAKEQLELAVFRNRFGNTTLENGELNWTRNPTTERMYNKEVGDLYRQIDRELLQNPEFQAFMNAKSTWFDNVKDEWMRQIDNRIKVKTDRLREIENIDQNDVELVRDLTNSDVGYGMWKNNLEDADARRIESMYKNNSLVQRIIGFHNTRNKFTNLEEGYYPQMISETRSEAAFHRFVEDEGVGNLSRQEQKEAFDQHYAQEMYRMNTDSDTRRMLQKYDRDSQEYSTYYDTRRGIQEEMDKVIDGLSDNPRYEDLSARLAQNKDDFIRSEQVKQYDEQGNIKLDDEGNPITKERHYLETPEDMDVNPFEIQNTRIDNNMDQFRSFYDDLMMGNIVRESNFLERPRVKYIPDELLETNLNTIRRRYSTDVGRRIHDARYNMFDEQELQNNYLNDIFSHAEEAQGASPDVIQDMQDRILSIYNYAHGNLNKTGRELRKQAKWKKVVDMFKNGLFGRFGYGFSWYNTFEHMVVGPHISSWDSVKGTLQLFTTNKQALDNTENLLRSWDIVRREIGSVNPDFERYGTLEGNQVDGLWSNRMNKVANYSADFSVAKNIGGKVFGWDVRDWGMARINPLFGDSFIGTNFVSSSINAQAALGEARHLADIAQELEQLPRGNRVAEIDGKTWTYGEVKRKLSSLGINEDRYDRFIQNKDKFSGFVDRMRGEEELSMGEIAQEEMPQHINDVHHVMQRATESFHGTNKLYRPETWHSPMGKALSTYSTYPFNFAMQTVNRRVRQPIKDWWNQYGTEQLGEAGRTTNAMKVLWNLKKGDIDSLKEMGLSGEAIENIPVDAYRSVLKHFRTLGIGTAGYLTMDAVDDVVSYPMNESTGADQWQNLERWKVLNPGAPEEDQMTWGDVDDNVGIENFMNVVMYGLGMASRGSMFGRYGDVIQNQYFLSRDGVMSLTPMTDMVNSSFKGAMDIARKPVVDWPETMTNKSMRTLVNSTPLLGASVFGELRKGIYEQIKLQTENEENGVASFEAEDTGAEIELDDVRTELE